MSEINENIKPAVSNSNEAINEMSAEEFQRTLHTWFENKGIVADLRAHLRRNMIDILKDTSLGQSVSQKQTSLAPKAQVINLLLVEFFMKHKYHFTLSVFSTEVPFLSILPDYSATFTNVSIEGASNADKPVIDSSFTEQNFWDILQTLGFSKDSVYSKILHDFYFNKNNEPLLTCIIRLLSNVCNKSELRNEFKNNIINRKYINNEMEPWIKDIYNLLTNFEIPDEIIVQLHDHLKSIFEKEHAKIKTEESTKFNFLHAQIQKDFQSREAEICKMINEMENTFYKEKQKLSGELLHEQDSISHLKQVLIEKEREYNDNLAALNRREESLKQRETEILEQTEILKSRIKIMQNVYDSIVQENARATHIKLHLKSTDSEANDQEKAEQSKLQSEYEYLRREIQETRETIKKFHQTISDESISKEKDHQNECEEKLLKGLLERVQAENAQLRLLNTQQQVRLDELTVRNSILMNDLENSQATINILSRSRIANQITVPPLLAPPPPSSRARSPRTGTLNGGGENLGFTAQPPMQPTYRHLVHSPPPRDSRRKVTRRLVDHGHATDSSDDSSQSPTEEILREARQRLRKLEEETESVDRSYQAFKERHSQSIQENLNINQQSPHTHYLTMPEHIRPMFQPRNSRDFYNSSTQNRRNIRHRSDDNFNLPEPYSMNGQRYYTVYNPSTDFQFPHTSKCTENFIQVTVNPIDNPEVNQSNGMMNMNYINENNVPSTSHGFTNNYQRHRNKLQTQNDNELDHNPRDDYRSSGASSAIIPQLHNLSLSSIEMSTDNPDLSDNKPAEKDM